MRAHEFITEAKVGSLQQDVAAALPATFKIPELANQDPYLQYRFGVAIASAKGRKQREQDAVPEFSKESAFGESEVVVSYDPNIDQWIDDALSQMNLSGKKLISTRASQEAQDVNKISPVLKFKE